jgi:hypothetical protein
MLNGKCYFPPPPLFWVILTTGGMKLGLLNDLPFKPLFPENMEGLPLKLRVGIFSSLTSLTPFFAFDINILYNIHHNKLCEDPTTSVLAPR